MTNEDTRKLDKSVAPELKGKLDESQAKKEAEAKLEIKEKTKQEKSQ